MISQSLYHDLCNGIGCMVNESLYEETEESKQFLRPYILVIHQPSGQGFYLDQGYRHIVDVENCQEPENPTKVARHHLCASSNLPAWALNIETVGSCLAERILEFDSFWLY